MKKAFTIVETLVAITVLMIAISGPLTVSFRALDAAVSSRNQIIATFLAQDAMEYVRNVKDNNIGKGDGWLDRLYECSKDGMCSVNTLTDIIVPECNGFKDTDCRLYRDPTTGKYSHSANPNYILTQFSRTFYIDNVRYIDSRNDVAEIVVDVVWSTGEGSYASTTMRTKIYNIAK